MGPASAVLDDLQGALPIRGLRIVATVMDDDSNCLSLAVVESSPTAEDLPQLPDDLDPGPEQPDDLDPDTSLPFGGGNSVPRTMTGAVLLAHVAALLQEDLAETGAVTTAVPASPAPGPAGHPRYRSVVGLYAQQRTALSHRQRRGPDPPATAALLASHR
jgi:hypothetical protein